MYCGWFLHKLAMHLCLTYYTEMRHICNACIK